MAVFVMSSILDRLRGKKPATKEPEEPDVPVWPGGFSDWTWTAVLFLFLTTALVQGFEIPTGSMEGTLLIGDRLLVNKQAYAASDPISRVLLPYRDPQRGDIIVFRFPLDLNQAYVKRVIGVPGDTVEYRDKRLTVNGQPVPTSQNGTYSYVGGGLSYITAMVYDEKLGQASHAMMVEPGKPSVDPRQVMPFPNHENCSYNAEGEGFACKVPVGHYFMMGDNRDQSNDSRYWGFVPDENIVGKAFFIWMNFDDFGRIGTTIR